MFLQSEEIHIIEEKEEEEKKRVKDICGVGDGIFDFKKKKKEIPTKRQPL